MDREQLIRVLSSKLKLIRTEQEINQEEMAQALGISKKTLVQIEKGRITAGWPIIVTACTLFKDSQIIQNELGSDPLDVLRLLAFEKSYKPLDKTMGGHVWWRTIERKGGYSLQQNLISQHFRIIDSNSYRWFSTFDEGEARATLTELTNSINKIHKEE